jgi:hypothetical protein
MGKEFTPNQLFGIRSREEEKMRARRSFSPKPYGCADVQDRPCEQFTSLRDSLAAVTAERDALVKAVDPLYPCPSVACALARIEDFHKWMGETADLIDAASRLWKSRGGGKKP